MLDSESGEVTRGKYILTKNSRHIGQINFNWIVEFFEELEDFIILKEFD